MDYPLNMRTTVGGESKETPRFYKMDAASYTGVDNIRTIINH